MNKIVELKQNEVLVVSGGMWPEIIMGNIGLVVGMSLGILNISRKITDNNRQHIATGQVVITSIYGGTVVSAFPNISSAALMSYVGAVALYAYSGAIVGAISGYIFKNK